MNRFLLMNELVACVVWAGVVAALVGSVGCSRVSIDDAQATTKRFMDALRSKDAEALAQATSYPFAFRELGDYVNCKPTAAKSRAELPAAMACVFDDELLGQQLKAATELAIEPPKPAMLEALKIPEQGVAGTVSLITQVPGNGANFFFVVHSDSHGVRELWKLDVREAN
jgi:hypothetical protein